MDTLSKKVDLIQKSADDIKSKEKDNLIPLETKISKNLAETKAMF